MTGPGEADPVILVSGFGRCGSSLVMQMLDAAGVGTTGEWPAFEDDRVLGLPHRAGWLNQQHGRAVKLLDPHIYTPPPGLPCRAIWLDRNPDEQSKSQAKFLRLVCGKGISRTKRRGLQASYRADRPLCLDLLRSLAGEPLVLSFEGILADPVAASFLIARHCRIPDPVAVAAMAQAVVPRDPNCLPGMMELDFLRETIDG
jgi:hypothetical protein